MIDWQSAVEANLEDESKPRKRKVHYSMPRKLGVTTFLVGLANRAVKDGGHVIFMVPDQRFVKEYQKRVEDGVVVVAATNIWNLKGWRFDVLIGDCVGCHNNTNQIPDIEREAVLNVTGYRLYMDSVD